MIKLFKSYFDVNTRCVVLEYIFSVTEWIISGSLMKILLVSAAMLTCWATLVFHSPVRAVSTERTNNREVALSILICQDTTGPRWHLT